MSTAAREVVEVITAHRQREGGGFIVRRPLPGPQLDVADPFLLIDELGPIEYAPGKAIGAPDHPHRGFETVTYVLEGESDHEDSAGHRGSIGPGAVQWMTAGAGIIHSEMPSARLQRNGGRMHGFQIWVNLPARLKMTQPRYQDIAADRIPSARSADGLATVRVIAGEALGVRAVIETHTPISYHDWSLEPGADQTTSLPSAHNAMVYVFQGTVRLGERGHPVRDGQLALLSAGEVIRLRADASTRFLLLSGAPIAEPVARYGPFVMNTVEELEQAVRDFQSGAMGEITRTARH